MDLLPFSSEQNNAGTYALCRCLSDQADGTAAKGGSEMFDKLIESEPEGADFKNRRSYFMVSSLVVAVFFATAVVFSLYAANIDLGSDNFVLSTMLAPVEPPPDTPEIVEPRQQPATQTVSRDRLRTRVVNMSRVDEPTIVPKDTSVVANQHLARPDTRRFELGDRDMDVASYSGPARSGDGPAGPGGTGLGSESKAAVAVREPEPPPAAKPPPAKPPTQSLGVINGRASYLPKPAYPQAAISLNVQGKVDVQVLIDEAGHVISAKALNGHPLLRDAAVRSARGATFTPTRLSNVPVKVTGVIVYNFTR